MDSRIKKALIVSGITLCCIAVSFCTPFGREMLSVAATIIAAVTFPILMTAGIIGGLIANFWLWGKFAEWLDKIFN